jgi:uncharacterized protein YeaO (DUF488 family)
MLLEGYLAKLKTYPKDEIKIEVTRSSGSILAPSWELLNDYKTGKIDWTAYEKRFTNEMTKPIAIREMLRIKLLAETKDVRLICYEKNPPCHRFILLRMILGTEKCPKCGSEDIDYYFRDGYFHCWICLHKWKIRD